MNNRTKTTKNLKKIETLKETILKPYLYNTLLNEFEANCTICLDDFTSDSLVVKLNRCKHIFHSTCLYNSLIKNASHPRCPNCNLSIFEQEEKDKEVTVKVIETENNRFIPVPSIAGVTVELPLTQPTHPEVQVAGLELGLTQTQLSSDIPAQLPNNKIDVNLKVDIKADVLGNSDDVVVNNIDKENIEFKEISENIEIKETQENENNEINHDNYYLDTGNYLQQKALQEENKSNKKEIKDKM